MQPRLAGVKSLNRLENVLARAEWRDPAIREGLLADPAGRLVEGTMSNVFFVARGALVTPDLSRCGVSGAQRERVLDLARADGIACEVRDAAFEELRRGDRGVPHQQPHRHLAGGVPRRAGAGAPGPVARRLQRLIGDERCARS